MRARNWASVIYDTEDKLALWWRWPFIDLADAIAMWEEIKTTDTWIKHAGDGSYPLEFRREHRWKQDSGIRRGRGTFIYDAGVGMSCGGIFLHESCHMLHWRASKPHGNLFLTTWVGLWKEFCRKPTFDAICDQLRQGGVPLEKFLP